MSTLLQRVGITGPVNVAPAERWLSLLGGGALAWRGWRRGGLGGTLMTLAGGLLLSRGATGHCGVKSALHSDGQRRTGPSLWDEATPASRGTGQVDDGYRPWHRVSQDQTRHAGDIHGPARNRVDEAMEESFPASDPPSHVPGVA